MDAFLEYVHEFPYKDPLDLIRTYGVLKCFAVWWLSMLTILFIGWIFQRRYRQQMFQRCGIPTPKVDSLIFGHYMTVIKDPIKTIHKWRKEFGPVFGHYVGETPFINISDVEMVRQLFVKDVSVFDERPPFALQVYPLSKTLLCIGHDHWKKVRSVLTPAFSAAKLKFMMRLINDSSKTFMQVVGGSADTGRPVCFLNLSQKLTLDVIARCALATKINCLVDDKDKLFNQVKEFLANSDTYAYHLANGIAAFDNFFKLVYRFTSVHDMMDSLVSNIRSVIKSRKEYGNKMEDMLQLMMDAAEENNGTISDEDVAANAFIFLLGGYETTAITMSMACYLLAKHPNEQEKLYEEVRSIWKEDTELNYEQVSQLKRTEAFLLETLRLFPPVITVVSRMANRDVTVKGYKIPKGVRVQASVYEIHMNEEYWPEPTRFDPERFLDTNASSQAHYLPFGIGPKMCIGKRFSLLEMKITFAHILKTYRLVRHPEMPDPPRRKLVNVTLTPDENGVPILVERRTPC